MKNNNYYVESLINEAVMTEAMKRYISKNKDNNINSSNCFMNPKFVAIYSTVLEEMDALAKKIKCDTVYKTEDNLIYVHAIATDTVTSEAVVVYELLDTHDVLSTPYEVLSNLIVAEICDYHGMHKLLNKQVRCINGILIK